MEPRRCSSLFLISCEAGEVFRERPSPNHLPINFTDAGADVRLFTCGEYQVRGLYHPPPSISICPSTPQSPPPLSQGGRNKSFSGHYNAIILSTCHCTSRVSAGLYQRDKSSVTIDHLLYICPLLKFNHWGGSTVIYHHFTRRVSNLRPNSLCAAV